MPEKPIAAYMGDEPYIFVSYAHEDADVVVPELQRLKDFGFNVWYDEGIAAGASWREELAQRILGARALVFLASPRSVTSDNCLKEIHFALENDRPIISVHMEDVILPPGVQLSLGDRQAVLRYELSESAYQQKLSRSLEALVTPSSVATTPMQAESSERPAIAVLPFATPPNDDELDYQIETLAEELTQSFQATSFRSVAHTSAMAYKGQHLDIRQVGHALGARYVMTGRARRTGNDTRMTMQLNETAHGTQIWTNRYALASSGLDESMESLAEDVMEDCESALVQAEIELIKDVPIDDLDAWGLLLNALRIQVIDRKSRDEVLALLRRAVDLEPNSAHMHCALAAHITVLVVTQFLPRTEEGMKEARDHAERAVQIAPQDAAPSFHAANVYGVCGDLEIALRFARRAYELSPVRWTRAGLAKLLIRCGRFEEAFEHQPKHVDLLTLLGRHEEALDLVDELLSQTPRAFLLWAHRGNILALLGRMEEARAAISQVKELVPTWTLDLHEKGVGLNFGRDEVVEACTAGLKALKV